MGLSCLSGAHNYLFPRVVQILKEKGAEEILVLGGGIIPTNDIERLKEFGTRRVFLPGCFMRDIVQYIQGTVKLD